MAEKNINVYLNSIQKMIKSGSPKYMSYISKQYMTYRQTSPIIAETIESMIVKSVSINPSSPYAVFLDQDGTMSLEAMDSISKITNLPEFISQVQELSKYDIDFKDVTSQDLIVEGDQMAEELAKELEEAENMTEDEQKNVAEKAQGTVTKLTGLALIGGVIGSRAKGLLDRIRQSLANLTNRKPKQLNEKEELSEEEKRRLEKIEIGKKTMSKEKGFESVCPKQDVDEEKALNASKQESPQEINKVKNTDNYGDGDPDGDDLDF